MIPLAAAAAVIVILLGTTVAVPRLFPGHGSPTIASGAAPPFYLGTRDGAELEVNNAATGQIVTQVPQPRKGAVLWIATATGRLTFLVAFVNRQEQQKCTGRLWLYRLRLTRAGQPLPMSLAATTALPGLLTAMSRDGQVLATMSNGCNAKPTTSLTVLNRSTHQVRHWTGTKPYEVPSLSGDGSVLVYATRSGIAVLPASAADGSLASRSRIVAPDREFGPGTVANHSRLAPDNTLYFATHHGNNGWQLRAYNLSTGRTRLLKDLPGTSLGIVSDPSGRYLLVRYGLNKVPPGPQLQVPWPEAEVSG